MKRALSTALATVLVAGLGMFAAPAAQAITGPGWKLVQCTPLSHCTDLMQQYAAKGYMLSPLRVPFPGVGNFDYHR